MSSNDDGLRRYGFSPSASRASSSSSLNNCSIPFIIHDIDAELVKRCGRYDEAIRSVVGCSSLPHSTADQLPVQDNLAASNANKSIPAGSSSIKAFELLATGSCSPPLLLNSETNRIPTSASSASSTDATRTSEKEYVCGRYFPFDFSALFYQSKSLLTLKVIGIKTINTNGVSHSSDEANLLPSATPSQRFLCEKYRRHLPHMAATTTSTATTDNDTYDRTIIIMDVDVMTAHRLLKPPTFEQVGGGGSSSGEKSCRGSTSVSATSEQNNDGHAFARILMASNWGALLGALFPLSMAGKRRVCRALLGNVQRQREIGEDNQRYRSGAKTKNEVEVTRVRSVEERQVGTLKNEETDPAAVAGCEKSSPPLPFSFLSPSGWKALRYDSHITDRFSYSYAAWLTFYGWRLHDEATGEVDRHASWRSRYHEMKLDHASCASVKISVADSHSQQQQQPSTAMKRMYYLSLTVVLQCLLELKLFPLAARLLLFMLEEFAAGRLRWLLEPRNDWFACDFGGENKDNTIICRFCGRLEKEVDGSLPRRRSFFCPHLISLCFLDEGEEEDGDGENFNGNDTPTTKSEGEYGTEEQQASSRRPLLKLGEDIKPLFLVNSSPSSSTSTLVSLFDDVWYPMVKHYNYAEGNCYDGNGDLRRLAKARAAVDATDSE